MKDSRPWRNWYGLKQWKALRAAQLEKEPWCKYCMAKSKLYRRADVVDHITPHKGDRYLFFDAGNLQSLCKYHHDSDKQIEEGGGPKKLAFDANGFPLNLDLNNR